MLGKKNNKPEKKKKNPLEENKKDLSRLSHSPYMFFLPVFSFCPLYCQRKCFLSLFF